MRRFLFPLLASVLVSAPLAAQSSRWTPHVGGTVFGLLTTQSTERGADGVAGAGWLGATLGKSSPVEDFSIGAMVSLEPLFQGKCGYPRLLAGAPACEDSPFEDYSHPHPFFMQLGITASRDLGGLRIGLKGGVAGDPALGPESYLHRPSAAFDPLAPMLMHEINPAHAVAGVVTISAGVGRFRLEGSGFNGGDGDQDPYSLDLASFKSWSMRARWQLSQGAALSLSHGSLQPSMDHAAYGGGTTNARTQIAALEAQQMLGAFMVALTGAVSRQEIENDASFAGLLEAQAQVGRHTLFARGEWAKREEIEGVHDLLTDEHFLITHDFRVAEIAGGYGVQLLQRAGIALTAGTRASITFVPEYLQPRYGHARGSMLTVFLNATPAKSGGHHH